LSATILKICAKKSTVMKQLLFKLEARPRVELG
jgi:hypothetical protein